MAEDIATPIYKHPAPHKEVMRRYKDHWTQQEFRVAFVTAAASFAASVLIAFYAIRYATESASNSVTDIVLSNIPPIDVDGFFVFGTLGLIVFACGVLLVHPRRGPFMLNTLALFYITRSTFITLTHIGPFPLPIDASNWGVLAAHFLFGSDLFFSAHTGAPFLLALMFWREPPLRYAFLIWSVYMAVVVLLGHYHYSIDVASAYFITYTIFSLAVWLFPKTHELFLGESRTVD